MSSRGFWYYLKKLLKKTGYLNNEKLYSAYVSAYTYYLSNKEMESWEKFEKICNSKGYIPDEWVKYTFNTLLRNIKSLDKGFSDVFDRALKEKRLII